MYSASRMQWVLSLVVVIMAMPALGSSPEDLCVEPLDSLLDCLAYAQGKAPRPTSACCANVGRVFEHQKKCLCELMGASFSGASTGLPPFNQSLALSLPSACRVPADPSECPGNLSIDPPIYLSNYLSIYLSIYLFVYLPVFTCLSICLYVCLYSPVRSRVHVFSFMDSCRSV
jgi:hypothetical protein